MNLEINHIHNNNSGVHISPIEVHNELKTVTKLRERNRELKHKLAKKYRHVVQLERRISYLENLMLVSQSGVVTDSEPPPGVVEGELTSLSTEQITAFADQDAGWTSTKEGTYDTTMDLANNSNSELGNFLGRPIRESAQSWVVGQPFYYKFNPWTAFCENSYVRDKIKNYELLRMKLHVKFVISGTKFHYGRALAAYNPYSAADQVTVNRSFTPVDLICASQKPHVFLNPTKNTGGQLDLPFFFPKNYMSIPDGDWSTMGDIIISSFGNLLHANGGNDPVTITTYIWAEDVALTVPTGSDPPLTSQSGRRTRKRSSKDEQSTINARDEYGQGIISRPAAAVAKAAGALTNLPVIGPYMTATQIGANAMSKIAQMFGYCRPNIVSDIVQMKPLPGGNLANTDAADGALKLTLDSKAEITVDSRTVGLDGTDEMGILDYCTRESYLTQFTWSPDAGPDSMLWNSRVCPMQLDNYFDEIHMTPLAHMSTIFSYWQGSLKFRFQIVKSDFHKGRILVRWDPNSNLSSVNYNTNYSRVVDIAETDDFEIVVGWGQADPFLPCGLPFNTGSNFSDSIRLIPDDTSNGVLELTVLNDLVSPSTDAPISVNVFVSACDDYKLAVLNNEALDDYHLFLDGDPGPTSGQGGGRPQSPRTVDFREDDPTVLESQSSSPNTETGSTTLSDKPTTPAELQVIGSKSDQDDPTYSVFFGDPPSSIRELCKRYCFTRAWFPEQTTADTMDVVTLLNKDMPYYTGKDNTGPNTGAVSGSVTLGPTAFSSWFAPSFAGVRGGYRKKYMFMAGEGGSVPFVSRRGKETTGNGVLTRTGIVTTAPADFKTSILTARTGKYAGNGAAATNTSINNTIEVELPFYMNKRFASPRIISAQELDCNSHEVYSQVFEPGTGNMLRVNPYLQFDAVAEDWSLFFFTGVPIYYKYTVNEDS